MAKSKKKKRRAKTKKASRSLSTQKKRKKGKKGKKRIAPLTIAIACIAIVCVVVSIVAIKANDKSSTPVFFKTEEKTTQLSGIDVSHHNGKIDWDKVKDDVDFAFIRVGYRGYGDGVIYKDKKAKQNLKNATKSEVPIGVYFYTQAINEDEAREEAKYVISKIKDYNVTLPIAIDFEYPVKNGHEVGRLKNADLTNKQRTKIINAFADAVTDAGYTPAVYASTYVYESRLNTKDLNDNLVIWVADYNSDITYTGKYDIWQYSEDGSCSGINSNDVDLDYWYINK